MCYDKNVHRHAKRTHESNNGGKHMTVRELMSALIRVNDLDREVNIYSIQDNPITKEPEERLWEIDRLCLNPISTCYGKVIHEPHPKVFIEIKEDEYISD